MPALIAAMVGALAMAITLATSEGRDGSDSAGFYFFVLPAGVVICTVLAWFFPTRVWRYGLAYGLAMAVVQFIDAGELGNLWPLVIVFNLVLSLPMILSAWVARRLSGN
jgi:hypothetical protein